MSKAGTVLLKGVAESRSTVVSGDTVTVHHATKHDSGKLIVCDWEFDFTGVTIDQMMKLASRSLVIDVRPGWKDKAEADAIATASHSFNVKELLTSQKRGKSIAEKVGTLATGLSDADKLALIAKLQTGLVDDAPVSEDETEQAA